LLRSVVEKDNKDHSLYISWRHELFSISLNFHLILKVVNKHGRS